MHNIIPLSVLAPNRVSRCQGNLLRLGTAPPLVSITAKTGSLIVRVVSGNRVRRVGYVDGCTLATVVRATVDNSPGLRNIRRGKPITVEVTSHVSDLELDIKVNTPTCDVGRSFVSDVNVCWYHVFAT